MKSAAIPQLSFLQVKNPKSDERSSEAAQQIFSSILSKPFVPLWKQYFNGVNHFSFELYLLSQTVYFYITAPSKQELFVKSLIQSSYPSSATTKTSDPLDLVLKAPHVLFAELVLEKSPYLPIKTFDEFKEVDALAPLIGFLSKQDPSIRFAMHIVTTHASSPWQSNAQAATKNEKNPSQSLNASAVAKKAAYTGGKALVRFALGADNKEMAESVLHAIGSTFGVFSSGDGNGFKLKKVAWFKDTFKERMILRTTKLTERPEHVLNARELATIWHPAGQALAEIKNVAWGKKLPGEPPPNLPTVETVHDDEHDSINFFAKAEFKNKETIFGLKEPDRRRHTYIIGKTGAGKSTLIANMAIDDIRKGRGVGVIDPHGDLVEDILKYIPKRRMKDVVYLEPFDTERPFSLNVLEVKNTALKDLVSSGIVSIFKKLYTDSWGPRLEYILRNSLITLLEVPGATLPDILELLGNPAYRKSVIPLIKDPITKSFWENEFEKMQDRMRIEAISPIQNKIGQFVQTKMIRNIIGVPKSTIDLREIMDTKKILLLNLSQGKLGEDNAALLGAMIITQIQLAAMGRAFVSEKEREDFFLYVDEFQNFATSSFIKILSEARKYRLSLILANQYIDQIDETIQHAIFGNVGTLISFILGAKDAEVMSKQYQGVYSDADLVGLGKHEILLKLCIDNMTSSPFPARTLPPPSVKNNNEEEIIEYSKNRYGKAPKVEPTYVSTPIPEHIMKAAPKPQSFDKGTPHKQPYSQSPTPSSQKHAQGKQTPMQKQPPKSTPAPAQQKTDTTHKPFAKAFQKLLDEDPT